MLYELQLKKEIKVQENEIVSSAKYFNNKKINTFDNGNFNCELYLKKKMLPNANLWHQKLSSTITKFLY